MAQFHDLMTYSVAWRMAVVLLDNLQGFKVCVLPLRTVPQDKIFYMKIKLHRNTWF